MSLDAGTREAVRNVMVRTEKDLREAKQLPQDGAPLVRLLEARVAKQREVFALTETADQDLAVKERAHAEAMAEVNRLAGVRQHGTRDRTEALAVEADFVCAQSLVRVTEPELAAARRHAASPLQRILAYRTDRGRADAENAMAAIVGGALRGTSYAVEANVRRALEKGGGLTAGELEWYPLLEARELKRYEGLRRGHEHASFSVAELKKVFASRRRDLDRLWRMLEGEVIEQHAEVA